MLGAKKVYNKCKCEKMRKADSAALNRYLKIELLVKIVNDCKLSTIFAILGVVLSSPLTTINQCFLRTTKDFYNRFMEWWLLLPTKILRVQSQQ